MPTPATNRIDMQQVIEQLKARSILDMCQLIHESITGSGLTIQEPYISLALSALCDRNEMWHPSTPATKEYDDAVREVVRATICEIKGQY